jgi:hypothetical protein
MARELRIDQDAVETGGLQALDTCGYHAASPAIFSACGTALVPNCHRTRLVRPFDDNTAIKPCQHVAA